MNALALSLFALSDYRMWGFGEWAKAIVIACGIIAILYVALQYFEITIPPFMVKVFWIVVAVLVFIAGINIIMSL